MKDESEDRINYIKEDLFKDKVNRSYSDYISHVSNYIMENQMENQIKR